MPRSSGQRWRWWQLALGFPLALFALATALLVANGLRDDVRPSRFALVLGNRVEPDGTPSPRLRARLDRAQELYRDGMVQAVVVSGGFGREGFDEADVMRDYLVAHGVPAERILLDHEGVDTYASARNLVRIIRERGGVDDHTRGTVIVVSQYFHVPRARLALRRFGIERVGGAHARFREWRDLYSVPREVFGYAGYLFRRYPAPQEDQR